MGTTHDIANHSKLQD